MTRIEMAVEMIRALRTNVLRERLKVAYTAGDRNSMDSIAMAYVIYFDRGGTNNEEIEILLENNVILPPRRRRTLLSNLLNLGKVKNPMEIIAILARELDQKLLEEAINASILKPNQVSVTVLLLKFIRNAPIRFAEVIALEYADIDWLLARFPELTNRAVVDNSDISFFNGLLPKISDLARRNLIKSLILQCMVGKLNESAIEEIYSLIMDPASEACRIESLELLDAYSLKRGKGGGFPLTVEGRVGYVKQCHDTIERIILRPYDDTDCISKPSPTRIIFSGSLYGSNHYFEAATKALESLCVDIDFLSLLSDGEVSLQIHTTRESLGKFQELMTFCSKIHLPLAIICDLGDLDRDGTKNRGFSYFRALSYCANHDAIYAGFAPDAIYGLGFSKFIKNSEGAVAAFAPIIRCSPDGIINLPMYFEQRWKMRTVSNRDYIRYALSKGFHPAQELQLSNISPAYYTRRCPDGVIRYSLSYMNLFVVRPSAEILREMVKISLPRYSNAYPESLAQPLDHELAHFLQANDLLHTPQDFEDFVLLESSSTNGYRNFSKAISIGLGQEQGHPPFAGIKIDESLYYLIQSCMEDRLNEAFS